MVYLPLSRWIFESYGLNCTLILCIKMGANRFFIVFLLLAGFCKAQTGKFSLKPSLGFTACQVHGDSYSGYNKLGFAGGLYINAALKKSISVEFGIIFIQKGAKHNQNPAKNDYRYYYLNLNYIELPLLLRCQYKKYFLTLGASAGYLANYYEASDIGKLTGLYPFQNFEYSCNIGAGRQLSPKFSFELRSNNSFVTIRPYGITSNVYYNNFIARSFNKGLYNNVLVISLFYKINTKTKSAESKT